MIAHLATIESIVKIIGVAIACFGIYIYINDLHVERGRSSFNMFEKFSDSPVLEAKSNIGGFAQALVKEADKNQYSSKIFRQKQFLGLSDKYRLDYNVIVDYFDRAKYCVDAKICDQSALFTLLENDATAMARYVRPLLNALIEDDQNHAIGLRCFSGLLPDTICFK